MKTPLLAATAVLGIALASFPASAQPGPRGQGDSGRGSGTMMGPGMMGERGFGFMCNPRAAGFAEWRIKHIEEAVKPTEAQKTALEGLRTASTKATDIIKSACAGTVPSKSSERLAFAEKRMEAMLQAIKTVRPAFETFYAGLDDQQQTKLDQVGPRRWGWRNWHWPWSDRD